jgi:pseudouridine-5'-phosphate glycosidase
MNDYLWISEEVATAFRSAVPVVALESTIISHGMPYPLNVETAMEAERIARVAGAVPATVAVMDGKIRVGLDGKALERLGAQKDVLKVSRRDLSYALVRRITGATTVSATMLGARMAGIDVFATGGIGGVHRGAGESFDISADLSELARTSLCVVSAGAKAILDISKTLEVLESLGVPVVGFRTSEFPAFYSRTSGFPVGSRVDSPAEIAQMLKAQRLLGFHQGILVANPVPGEWEIPHSQIESYVEQAMGELQQKGIRGKGVTPFLLSRIVELSGGRSLTTNVALFYENVRLGCLIASELVKAR